MVEYEWPRPKATVDVALFALAREPGAARDSLHVALAPRGFEPDLGRPALPGMSVRFDEPDLDAMARRVLRDLLGVDGVHVEQLVTRGGRDRDPGGWSVTTVYYALVPASAVASARPGVTLTPADGLSGLPYDHDRLVAAGVARVRSRSTYTSLPALALPAEFTMTELREAYAAAIGREVQDAWFRRRVEGLTVEVDGAEAPWLVATGRKVARGRHRAAALYRRSADGVFDLERMF